MTEAATAVIEGKKPITILTFVRRTRRPDPDRPIGDKPKVLVGKRHDKVVFMPGKYVFPRPCR
jgi:hypothetical protein